MIVCIIEPCTDGSDALGASFLEKCDFYPIFVAKSVKQYGRY